MKINWDKYDTNTMTSRKRMRKKTGTIEKKKSCSETTKLSPNSMCNFVHLTKNDKGRAHTTKGSKTKEEKANNSINLVASRFLLFTF